MTYTFREMDRCPPCEYAGGNGTWPVVAASKHALAFVPSRHPTPGTTLVAPRRHVEVPMALSDEESDDVFLLLRRLIAATMTTFGCPNYHISQYVGEITEEPLPHLHWRLEPRFDAPPSVWVPFSELPSLPLEERERIAENLRAALGADQAAI